MALDGTLSRNIASGYRLQLEWTATQDKVNNKSTITTKLYWMSLGSSYTINSSATKSGQLEIGGDIHEFSGAGLADLNGNQKKLISSHSQTVSHNSDGSLKIWIAGYFNPSVTLSGTYYGQQSVSQIITLDTIPRESSITSSLNFKAPNSFPISISRNSTSYTHNIRLFVNNVSIKTLTGVGTNFNVSWSQDELTKIYQQLAQTNSKALRIELDTMNGSTKIGSTKLYNGTCYTEEASTSVENASFQIGNNVTASIARNSSSFKHIVKFYVNGTVIHTSPLVDSRYTWTPTQGEKDTAFGKTPNSNTTTSKVEITTYYNGVQIQVPTSKTGTASVVNSNPSFGTGYTYEDTNATTLSLTGNKLYIIQKKSTVKVIIPVSAKATALNKATMIKYTASLDGQTVTQNWSDTADLTFNFNPVSSSSNLTLSIMAIDSRGNATKTTKTVLVVPYATPSMNASAKRKNGFEAETSVSLQGSFSAISINNTVKNAILGGSYRYRENIASALFPSVWTPFTITPTNLNYASAIKTETLDQTKQYIFEFKITDKLGDTIVSRTVSKGQPILFVDTKNDAIGVNKFPADGYKFDVSGKSRMEDVDIKNAKVDSIYVNSSGRFNQNGSFALDANNGDIVRVNGIYTSDTADNGSEGYNFLKSTGASGSKNTSDYDSFWIKDGTMFLNGKDLRAWVEAPRNPPEMLNSWVNYYPIRFARTYEGIVTVQGLTNGGVLDKTIFNLPVGYRPMNRQAFVLGSRNKTIRVEFNTDGSIVPSSTDGVYDGWISFAGVCFMTVDPFTSLI